MTSARIMNMLPDWTTCDQLIEIYCQHCENIHRIMHLPSLLSAYRQLRESAKVGDPFIPQFSLIIVVASRLWRKDFNTEVGVVLDPQEICLRVGRWLAELADKECMTFSTLQTYTLLVIAKQGLPSKSPAQLWRATGDLVRSAMILGLHHQEPKVTLGERDIKMQTHRWLWLTIIELDLQASMSCCMSSLVGVIDFTTQAPFNVSDLSLESNFSYDRDEIEGMSKVYPAIQIELSRSTHLRMKALNLLTKWQADVDAIEDLLRQLYDEKERLLLKTPVMRYTMEPENMLQSFMLDMCFKKPMISLYTLLIQRYRDTKDERLLDACRAFINFAAGVVNISNTLDPQLSDYDVFVKDERYWIAFQGHHGDDLIRVTTVACFASQLLMIDIFKQCPTHLSPAAMINRENPTAGGIFCGLTHPQHSVRRMAGEVVESLIRLTPDLRSILKQVMALALAAEITRVHTNYEDLDAQSKEKHTREALNKVFRLCKVRHEADRNNSTGSQIPAWEVGSASLSEEDFLNDFQFDDLIPFDWDNHPEMRF